jgi:hypothetical protein
VSFTLENKRLPNYTDWMKHRVDSQQGKEVESTRPVAAILPGAQHRETGELRTDGGMSQGEERRE